MRASLLKRLAALEAMHPDRAWQLGEGLAAILTYVRTHPRSPWDLPDLDDVVDEPTGLAQCLKEAQKEARTSHL